MVRDIEEKDLLNGFERIFPFDETEENQEKI